MVGSSGSIDGIQTCACVGAEEGGEGGALSLSFSIYTYIWCTIFIIHIRLYIKFIIILSTSFGFISFDVQSQSLPHKYGKIFFSTFLSSSLPFGSQSTNACLWLIVKTKCRTIMNSYRWQSQVAIQTMLFVEDRPGNIMRKNHIKYC